MPNCAVINSRNAWQIKNYNQNTFTSVCLPHKAELDRFIVTKQPRDKN